MTTPPKGLRINIFRWTMGDCTNGGPSAKYDTAILVGPGIAEIFSPEPGEPVMRVVERNVFPGEPTYKHLEVVGQEGMKMMGGNFAYSCDSRFGKISRYPLPIHDRVER